MAVVTVPATNKSITDAQEIGIFLKGIGIDYEFWNDLTDLDEDADDNAILQAYGDEIEALKIKGGYTTADVINITPSTPNLDAMLEKFNKEHWHDEDEVRFIIKGHGLFHIAPENSDVVSVLMSAGDMIRIPRGTKHWFDLCDDRNVRAIRLFQDISGWTPYYTGSGIDAGYQPQCFGLSYLPHVAAQR